MRLKKLHKLAVNKFSESPSGNNAVFVAINDDWGVKIYASRRARDKGFNRQKEAAQHGFAPEVGGSFELPAYISDSKYCYVTERVETFSHGNHCFRDYKFCEKWETTWKKQITEIQDKYDILFLETYMDIHPGNFGLKNGKLVLIDM